jgi:hypothetical protein
MRLQVSKLPAPQLISPGMIRIFTGSVFCPPCISMELHGGCAIMTTTTILILLACVVGPFLSAFTVIRLHRMLKRRNPKDPNPKKRD